MTLLAAHAWIHALAATTARLNGTSPWRLGLEAVGTSGREDGRQLDARKVLARFGMRDRDELLAKLADLEAHGVRADFARALGAARGPGSRSELARRQRQIARRHVSELGPAGVLAFDAAGLVAYGGAGYRARYCAREEVYARLLPLARQVQQSYGSWAHFGRAALVGRCFMLGVPVPEHDPDVEWLLHASESPWRRLAWHTDLGSEAPFDDDGPLRSIAVRVGVRCPSCYAATPVNRIAEHARCGGCLAPIELSPDDWRSWLVDALEGARYIVWQSAETVWALDDVDACVEASPRDVRCVRCDGSFDLDAVRRAGRGGVSAVCATCHELMPVRRADGLAGDCDELALFVAGEAGSDADAPLVAEAIVCTCEECGAALRVDGTRRNVCCGFCQGEQRIPEALWDCLHVPRRRHIHFIGPAE